MKTLLRFLQSLIIIIVSIPMVVCSYLQFTVISIVMWKDMRDTYKEYTERVIEMFKASVNYIVNG